MSKAKVFINPQIKSSDEEDAWIGSSKLHQFADRDRAKCGVYFDVDWGRTFGARTLSYEGDNGSTHHGFKQAGRPGSTKGLRYFHDSELCKNCFRK